MNNIKVLIIGILIDGDLFVQKPRIGERINWPNGLAATTRLKNTLPAFGSSYHETRFKKLFSI